MSNLKKTKKRTKTSKAPSKKNKNDYIATLSHELRTPLNAIIGFSEMLSTGKAGKMNKEQREYLKDILVSGKDLLRLIQNAAEKCTRLQAKQRKKSRH
jgi:protein-histidine pros-kinase